LAQRSRFCTMGAIRDFVLFRQMHLLSGFIALIITALIVFFGLLQNWLAGWSERKERGR